MNSVIVRKDRAGRFCGFTSSGHAGAAEKGKDIVCAGISALTMTAALALCQFTTLQPTIRDNARKAILECDWVNEPDQVEKSDLIIKMMLLGLAEIQKQFPNHLSIEEKEV